MPHRSGRTRLLVAVALLVPAGLLATAQTAAAAPTGLVAIESTVPHWLSSSGARRLTTASAADPAVKLTIKVYLAPRGGQAALEQAATAVSDPSSSTYGQFLSARAFRSAYTPTKASAKKVSRWLRAKHLKVTGTEAHRRYVTARGTVAQLDEAFGISLTDQHHDGQHVIAPTSAAMVPASVASAVLTVAGLDTTSSLMQNHREPDVDVPDGVLNARPCSTSFGQMTADRQADRKTALPKFKGRTLSYAPCGYTGPQLRSAYTGGTALTGAGVTIAVTGAYRSSTIVNDTRYYALSHGDRQWVAGQLTETAPSSYRLEDECYAPGWTGEQTLDIEAVHAMAPAAAVHYYAASSCQDDDLLDALRRAVDKDDAQVVTSSWGDLEANITSDSMVAHEQVFLQGTLQGQTFLFASGDAGDTVDRTGLKQVSHPASSPWVTAVGGTATAIGSDGSRLFDAGWGSQAHTLARNGKSWVSQGFRSGAGGGYSTLFNRPSYQEGKLPNAPSGGRALPDVAMDADIATGMLIGQTQRFGGYRKYSEYRIGGTSLSCPLLAGMTALAVEQNGRRGLGLLNPTLYAAPSATEDVVPRPDDLGVVRPDYRDPGDPTSEVTYSVRTFGEDSSLPVTVGWDPVTGLGVPTASFLQLTNQVPDTLRAAAGR